MSVYYLLTRRDRRLPWGYTSWEKGKMTLSMQDKMKSLQENHTYDLVKLLKNIKALKKTSEYID